MNKKIIMILVVSTIIFTSCESSSFPINFGDDTLSVSYNNDEFLTITNNTNNNIVIGGTVYTNQSVMVLEFDPPNINDPTDLSPKESKVFEIYGFVHEYQYPTTSDINDFAIVYFKKENNDLNNDNIPDSFGRFDFDVSNLSVEMSY